MNSERIGYLGRILQLLVFSVHANAVEEVLPYRQRHGFLSAAELSFYQVPKKTLGTQYVVSPKVNLWDPFSSSPHAGSVRHPNPRPQNLPPRRPGCPRAADIARFTLNTMSGSLMNDFNQKTPRELNCGSEHDLGICSLRPHDINWPKQLAESVPPFVDVIGDPTLLSETVAAFCSSQYPGDAILETMKWISELAEDETKTVIGGFHSAMEKSFL